MRLHHLKKTKLIKNAVKLVVSLLLNNSQKLTAFKFTVFSEEITLQPLIGLQMCIINTVPDIHHLGFVFSMTP